MGERCPLCGDGGTSTSWLGTIEHAGARYEFVRCTACGSFRCTPMPSAETLAVLYGADYVQGDLLEGGSTDKDRAVVIRHLRGRMPGTFVDYGCGSHGELLRAATDLGWDAIGIEYDRDVAAAAEAASGARTITVAECADATGVADVVHFGDVVEHLTDAATELRAALAVARPGATVLAQGPLEANACLFTAVIGLTRRARGRGVAPLPPYHVLLATAVGQRRFFARLGLEEIAFDVSEVSWPAPSAWTSSMLRQPRLLSLFALRRASQGVSRLALNRLGNRYVYVGRVPSGGVAET